MNSSSELLKKFIISGRPTCSNGHCCWQAPANIALVKYWGKFDEQRPQNPSLSFTLDKAHTISQLNWHYDENLKGVGLEFNFDGRPNQLFEKKIKNYLLRLAQDIPLINQMYFEINSKNSFPHSTGIASSASSMASLSLCLLESLKQAFNQELSKQDFRAVSYLARLGSGSAARSLFSPMALWGEVSKKSVDFYATEISNMASVYNTFHDAILIVDSSPKTVSSREGHALMSKHPYNLNRFNRAKSNLENLLSIMQNDDVDNIFRFCELVEAEAMDLHGLMMSSSPSYMLLKPNTLAIIEKIKNFREMMHLPVCFTLDAGPNVHFLYPRFCQKDVQEFINKELIILCENGKYFLDNVGQGPTRLS